MQITSIEKVDRTLRRSTVLPVLGWVYREVDDWGQHDAVSPVFLLDERPCSIAEYRRLYDCETHGYRVMPPVSWAVADSEVSPA